MATEGEGTDTKRDIQTLSSQKQTDKAMAKTKHDRKMYTKHYLEKLKTEQHKPHLKKSES